MHPIGPIFEKKYFKSIPPNPQAIKLCRVIRTAPQRKWDLLQYLTIISKVMPLI